MKFSNKIILLFFTVISSTLSNKLRQFLINDPGEITFDITNVKNEDFIIKTNNSSPRVYNFKPRPGKTVARIKIEKTYVWYKFGNFFVSEIWVYSDLKKNLMYNICLMDRVGNSNVISYSNSGKVVKPVGMIEFLSENLNLFVQKKRPSKFDLNSIFDYRFNNSKVYQTKDGKFKLVLVEPKATNYFQAIYEGSTLVYQADPDKLVKRISIVLKNDNKYIMKVELSGILLEKPCFKYQDNKWIEMTEFEYEMIYIKDTYMKDITEFGTIPSKFKYSINLFQLTPDKIVQETTHNLLNVKTIKICHDNLYQIEHGKLATAFLTLKNVQVYLFKGKTSYEMIEIVSHLKVNSVTRKPSDKEDPLIVLSRNNNYYYLRINNKWVETNQTRFLSNFKELAKEKLMEEIEGLAEDDTEKRRKIQMVEILCNLIDKTKLIPEHEMHQTDKVTFTEEVPKPTHSESSAPKPESGPRKAEPLAVVRYYTSQDLDDEKSGPDSREPIEQVLTDGASKLDNSDSPGSKPGSPEGPKDENTTKVTPIPNYVPTLRTKHNFSDNLSNSKNKNKSGFLSYSIFLVLSSLLIQF